MFDTIVAPITGAPPAAVAWVRLSGQEAWSIASQVFLGWPAEIEPRRAIYGSYAFGDDGLMLPFEEGHSYTGEQSVELSCHGSKASVDALVEACLVGGARLADPGEFTLRAFLNGRIDLTQAEGVRESCEALTERQLRLAEQLRSGKLREQVSVLRLKLAKLLASLEASVDFSEEIGDFDRRSAAEIVTRVAGETAGLLSNAVVGRWVREGVRIAIVGLPNAGKSSLLNAVLGFERAIVSEIPGTTRDFIEERVLYDGIPLVFIDTAGLRRSDDKVETIGIAMAKKLVGTADLIWYVYDSTAGWTEADGDNVRSIENPNKEIIASKVDLGRSSEIHQNVKAHFVSAMTGVGLESILQGATAVAAGFAASGYVNDRHRKHLEATFEVLRQLRSELDSEAPSDLLSVLLNQAIDEIGAITGETASVDMIDQIFRDFCIGK